MGKLSFFLDVVVFEEVGVMMNVELLVLMNGSGVGVKNVYGNGGGNEKNWG